MGRKDLEFGTLSPKTVQKVPRDPSWTGYTPNNHVHVLQLMNQIKH